jgi:hypothetical protein
MSGGRGAGPSLRKRQNPPTDRAPCPRACCVGRAGRWLGGAGGGGKSAFGPTSAGVRVGVGAIGRAIG